MVGVGLTPAEVTNTLPSMMNRFFTKDAHTRVSHVPGESRGINRRKANTGAVLQALALSAGCGVPDQTFAAASSLLTASGLGSGATAPKPVVDSAAAALA